jgi:hypothetical protein
MGGNIWLVDFERALDQFAEDGDEECCRATLAALGLDRHEIDDEIVAVRGEI